MLERTPVLIVTAIVAFIAWRLGRSYRHAFAGALLLSCGLVLVADDYFGWLIPGAWGLTGGLYVGWGLREFWEARPQRELPKPAN